MGPHGIFAIAPAIQTLINDFILGAHFHLLAAPAVFYVPVYNIILKLMGYKSVDRPSFVDCLKKGRSVGIVPGGIPEMFVAGEANETLFVCPYSM